MRNICFILFLILLNSCKKTYPKLSLDAVSENEKQRVYDFGKKIAETCITREFIQLSTKEVTQDLAKLSLDEMQKACDHLDKTHGKYIDMELIEIIDDTYRNNNLIYRYKANFEKNVPLKEIRIWVLKNGKFAGIIYKDWKDQYTTYK